MKLIHDWRRVVALSFSFWAQVLGLLVLIVPEVIYAATGRDYDPYIAWWAGVLLLLFGLIGRLVEQRGGVIGNALRTAAVTILIAVISVTAARADDASLARAHYAAQETATFAIWLPKAEQFEGVRLTAYRDPVGIPTICMGSTVGVVIGMRMTLDECRALFLVDARSHRGAMLRYYLSETVLHRLPPTRDAAFADFGFNAGVSAAGKSTAMHRLNAGDLRGSCKALTWWSKAGGRVLRGLVVRTGWREASCMIGVTT